MQISNNPFMIIFGGIQIVLSQIPNIDNIWLLSFLSATMSISYSLVCIGLSIGKATCKLNTCVNRGVYNANLVTRQDRLKGVPFST